MEGLTLLRNSLLVPTERELCFLLLGYPLFLSRTEATLLRYLITNKTISTKHLTGRSANTLAAKICGINKKAHRISGRRLILFSDGAYRFNPYL
ncbi:MAG: hypothetical protein J6Q82_01605 [Clostridia bacterium]|nr:hypothetical protein [Clostridia bacterium]